MSKKMGVGLQEALEKFGVKTVQWRAADPSGEIDPETGRTKMIVVSGPFRPEVQAFEPRHYRADAGIVLPGYSQRYGDSPPGAEPVGRSAELLSNNQESLKQAFAAGKLGSAEEYDGEPTDQEVTDAAFTGVVEIGELASFALDRLTGDVGTLSRPLHVDEEGKEFGATRKVVLAREIHLRVGKGGGGATLAAGSVVYAMNVHGGRKERVDLQPGDYTEIAAAGTGEVSKPPAPGEKPPASPTGAKPTLSPPSMQTLGELRTWATEGKGIGANNPRRQTAVFALLDELDKIFPRS